MNEHDLTNLLRTWPHESGRINARVIEGEDGRPKLQIRVELGVLQMEMTGRPDGAAPDGAESLLERHQARLAAYEEQSGSTEGFVLSTEECAALREEAVQYYHRYVGLFALGEHGGVVRDTQRNLACFDLCRDHGTTDRDRTVLEQFRPSVIMMRVRSEAELALADEQPKAAMAAIDRGLEEIRRAFQEAGEIDGFENAREVQLLRGMRDALVPKLPVSQISELRQRLQAALEAENYELAAILRDELRLLE